jgi:hypothetical protein
MLFEIVAVDFLSSSQNQGKSMMAPAKKTSVNTEAVEQKSAISIVQVVWGG